MTRFLAPADGTDPARLSSRTQAVRAAGQAVIDASLAVYDATDRDIYGAEYSTRLRAAEAAWGETVRAYRALTEPTHDDTEVSQ